MQQILVVENQQKLKNDKLPKIYHTSLLPKKQVVFKKNRETRQNKKNRRRKVPVLSYCPLN